MDLDTPIKREGQLALSIGPLPQYCQYTKGRPSLWQVMDPEGILDLQGGDALKGKIDLAKGATTTINLKAVRDGCVLN